MKKCESEGAMAYGYHAPGGVAFGRFLFGAVHRDLQAIAYSFCPQE